jgi:hypothetical protein
VVKIVRIAVVFFAEKKRDKLLGLAKGLARGFEAGGHSVDLIDGIRDTSSRLTAYEYLAVGCESLTFFTGKISPKISVFLSNCGMISGKRSCAFVPKSPLSSGRSLARLMKAMEHEGMYLKYSEILLSADQAEAVGKRIVL